MRHSSASKHGPGAQHTNQGGASEQSVVKLHCSSVLKEPTPALNGPVLIRDPLPIHEGEVIIGSTSIHASNKNTCSTFCQHIYGILCCAYPWPSSGAGAHIKSSLVYLERKERFAADGQNAAALHFQKTACLAYPKPICDIWSRSNAMIEVDSGA